MGSCNFPQTLNGTALTNVAAFICNGVPDDSAQCVAICPNADLSGIGVRIALYIQSCLNTLLVVLSRRDSVPSTWAATLLTGSLVIAAMVQKYNQAITLHHATLILNFATLSCISSLAVAPTLSIWRLTPQEYYRKRLERDILDDHDDDQDRMISDAVDTMTGRHRRRIERAQSRQRLILAIAILTQVVLQWAWGIWLFVDHAYSQTNCSGVTTLIFFFHPFKAEYINGNMFVWVAWLLFSLGITMFMTIVLALTSPSRARPWTAKSSPGSGSIVTRTSSIPESQISRPVHKQLYDYTLEAIPVWKEQVKHFVFWYNVVSVFLWIMYIIVSELQIRKNCIFEGENSFSGFGQITAFLLSLAPLWSVIVAVYKWPERQRKLARRRRRELQRDLEHTRSLSSQVALSVLTHDDDPDDDPPRGKGVETTVTVVAAPGCERAAPLSTLRPRAAHPRTHGRSRSRSPAPPQPSPAPAHPRLLSLDHFYLPRTSTEEWNELATFRPAQ